MLKICCHASATALYFLLALPSTGTPVASASSASSPLTSVISTCPAQTINYITQTLPQQCLKSGWSEEHATLAFVGGPSSKTDTVKGSLITEHFAVLEPFPVAAAKRHEYDSSAHSLSAHIDSSASAKPTGDQNGITELSFKPSYSSPSKSEASALPKSEIGSDAESPLDNAHFLSFNEWKNQNLARVDQSHENIGTNRAQSGRPESRRRPGSINNALDSLGEDAEIELDFSGFVNPGLAGDGTTNHGFSAISGQDQVHARASKDGKWSPSSKRSKDAGTTCKERTNYASFDCAASVLKTNLKCRGSTSILVENKDSYMLNECAMDNKFLIIELCNDILVDTVVLANYEFFSSMFRSFRVSVSDRYPVKLERWKDLGTFVARNSREVQAFAIETPLIWARYLRIEFLTHYGNEFYCPVSLLRVHGITMIEEYKHQEEALSADESDEMMVEDEVRSQETYGRTENDVNENKGETSSEGIYSMGDPRISTASPTSTVGEVANSPVVDGELQGAPNEIKGLGFTPNNAILVQQCSSSSVLVNDLPVCIAADREVGSAVASASASPVNEVRSWKEEAQRSSVSTASNGVTMSKVLRPSHGFPIPTMSDLPHSLRNGSNISEITQNASSPASTRAVQSSQHDHTSQVFVKVATSSTQPPSANPTTQESFYKSVHKRLQLLEANSTLSLQYIEEQSRILRDAFTKVEKRQLSKTNNFLEILNTTVLGELRDFRKQYDQIWQSTVLELSAQREQSQREIVALSSRLSLLADEILLQKRMAIVQFLLILLCLGLVIFSRSPATNYLELPPLVQSMVTKSSQSISRYATFESPPSSPAPTRLLGRTTGHQRDISEESNFISEQGRGAKSLRLECSPPTPTSEPEDPNVVTPTSPHSDEPEADVAQREAKSGPSTPTGKRVKLDPLDVRASRTGKESLLSPLGPSPPRTVELATESEIPS